MGLFTSRPYKMDSLSSAEKAAVSAACEVVIDATGNADIRNAYKHFQKGALSKEEMAPIIAATAACLKSLKDNDDNERTTELQKKQVAVLALAMAVDKLMKML